MNLLNYVLKKVKFFLKAEYDFEIYMLSICAENSTGTCFIFQ